MVDNIKEFYAQFKMEVLNYDSVASLRLKDSDRPSSKSEKRVFEVYIKDDYDTEKIAERIEDRFPVNDIEAQSDKVVVVLNYDEDISKNYDR